MRAKRRDCYGLNGKESGDFASSFVWDKYAVRKEVTMEKVSLNFKRGNVVAAAIASVALAGCLACAPAVQSADAAEATSYVTAAASRAAGPAPEILGLTGVEESGQFVFLSTDDVPQYSWSYPKYYLFGNASYNANPNQYFVNSASGSSDTGVVYNASRGGGGAGPNASLAAYGSDDDTDNAVWEMLPDVIIGKGGTTDYSASASAVSDAKGLSEDDPYSPISVAYSFSNNSNMVTLMYSLASAADASAADGEKSLRYGSATTIAMKYEAYVKGVQGYILQQLSADMAKDSSKTKKTVASIADYDKDTKTFTLRVSNVQDGTASTNRYLEVCEQVANNVVTDATNATMSADALEAAKVDLVLVGGQSGGSSVSQDTILEGLEEIGYSAANGNVYYADSNTAGAAYGVVMNSVENAQNVGRILGCLYPEYVDQEQLVDYYYENFYHINVGANNATLGTVIDNAMDGVYNYDAKGTTWDASDGTIYDESIVLNYINSGLSYIRSLDSGSVPTALQLTDNLKSSSVVIGQ